jgi:hypothetical protein
MTVFDLLFLAAALATTVTLLAVALLASSGRRAKALKVLEVLGICVVLYLGTGLTVSLLKPQRVFPIGDPWCADDWCLSVQQVTQTPAQSYVSYNVSLRIFSRARRVAQRARGAWLYMIDDRGRRYSPQPDPSEVTLDVLLQPGESVTTSRVFRIPGGAHVVGVVTEHGGPYCGPMDILVIGESGCVFNKPTMIRIP